MDKNNKKHAADTTNTTNNKKSDRTEFADEINVKDTQAKTSNKNNSTNCK